MNAPRRIAALASLTLTAAAVGAEMALPGIDRTWPFAAPAVGGFAVLGAGAVCLAAGLGWVLRWLSRPEPPGDAGP